MNTYLDTPKKLADEYYRTYGNSMGGKETADKMYKDMLRAKDTNDAFEIGNIYTNLNFYRFSDDNEIVKSQLRLKERVPKIGKGIKGEVRLVDDIYFDYELAKPYLDKYLAKEEGMKEIEKMGVNESLTVYAPIIRYPAMAGGGINAPVDYDNLEDAFVYAKLNGYSEIVKQTSQSAVDWNPDYEYYDVEDVGERMLKKDVVFKHFKSMDEQEKFLDEHPDYNGGRDEIGLVAYKVVDSGNLEGEDASIAHSNRTMTEDTIKQGNAWVNKGKEGTHGKFRTKKEADAQRKAMFARGYKGEELKESDEEQAKNKVRKFAIEANEKFGDDIIAIRRYIFANTSYNIYDIKKWYNSFSDELNLTPWGSGTNLFRPWELDESLNESAYEDFMNEIRSTDEYWRVSKILERAYNALPLEQYKKVYAEAQKVKDEIMASHDIHNEFKQLMLQAKEKFGGDITSIKKYLYANIRYNIPIKRWYNSLCSELGMVPWRDRTDIAYQSEGLREGLQDYLSDEAYKRYQKAIKNGADVLSWLRTHNYHLDDLDYYLTGHPEVFPKEWGILKESSDYGVCKKCGKKLIPGENYYTMSTEKVCTDCGNKPDYSRLKPARKSVGGDYEDKILAKQELGEAKRQDRIFYKGAAIYDGDYYTAEKPPFYVYIDRDSSKIKQEEGGFDTIEKAKAYIDDVRSKPHFLSKYEKDYYSGPEEGGYTSEGLVLVDSKQFPDYDSAVKAFEKELNTYDKDEIEFEGNDVFADTYGWEYHIERRRGVDNSPAESWAEAELGEDFVARQADEVLEGAVGNLSDKEVDKLLGTLRKAKKLLGVNRIEDIYYVQSEDDPEDWQRELEFTKENINSKVDFFNSKKYNISVVREKLDNGSTALYFADEDSVNRYHDITGNYYDDNFDYSV